MADNTTTVFIKADASGVEQGAQKAAKSLDKVKKESATLGGAFSNLSNVTDALNVNFGGMGVNIGMAKKAFTGIRGSIQAATVSTRAFSMALAATGIGAIVIALGALFQAFRSTQTGSDALNDAMLRIKSAIGAVWGLIQEFAVDKFTKIFTDPKQAVMDLWEAIKTNLLNRFEGLIESFQALGRAAQAAFRLDWSGMKQASNEFGEAFVKTMTGVEDIVGKTQRAFERVNQEMERGSKIGGQIARIEKEIARARINAEVPLRRARRELAEQQMIARDITKTDEERLAAVDKMQLAAQRVRDLQAGITQLEVRRLELMNSINDTSDEDLLLLQQKKGELEDIDASYATSLTSVQRIKNSIGETNEELLEQKETLEDIDPLLARAEMHFNNTRTRAEQLQAKMEEVKSLIDSGYFDALGQNGEEVLERLRAQMSELADETERAGNQATNNLAGGFQILFSEAENKGEALIRFVRQLAARLAAAAISAAIVNSLFPGGGMAVGAAAGGVKSALGGIPMFANGGIVSGPTLGLMGEYAGASTNPEVIAPLDKLKSMMGSNGGGNVNVTGEFVLKGQDLVVSLERTNKKNRR